MAEVPINNQIYGYNPFPMNQAGNIGQNAAVPQPAVNVQPQNTSQIYQYPQTSLYDPNQKTVASGVNIYIYNPTGIGQGGQAGAPQVVTQPAQQPVNASTSIVNNGGDTNLNSPIANTPLQDNNSNDKKTDKKKQIVELTDDYIKTLENYLRSMDKNVRKSGIINLIKRYEEDPERYNDPALTALLNIALQDPDANNRQLAMSVIVGGNATGDENTVQLLKNLQSSDKLFGQEAKMASEALLNAVEQRKSVPKE